MIMRHPDQSVCMTLCFCAPRGLGRYGEEMANNYWRSVKSSSRRKNIVVSEYCILEATRRRFPLRPPATYCVTSATSRVREGSGNLKWKADRKSIAELARVTALRQKYNRRSVYLSGGSKDDNEKAGVVKNGLMGRASSLLKQQPAQA